MSSILDEAREAIEAAIPGSVAVVRGGGGHFEIEVTAAQFDGLRTLAKHRLVLTSIAHLMKGDEAPIHAVDNIVCRTP